MNIPPISLSQKKLLRKLSHKKHRQEEGLFIVAGRKSVLELQHSRYQVRALFLTPRMGSDLPFFQKWECPLYEVDAADLSALSSLTHHGDLLALVESPLTASLPASLPAHYLILDDIQQPQNLGALLRVADWYGISHIVASPHTVDFYNPKVIQASMGSFVRVSIYYTPLIPYLQGAKTPILGATLTGENLHTAELPSQGALLLGNEGRGIQKALYAYLTKEIKIPQYGGGDSLNVAVAAGIICDKLLRV